MLSTGSIAGPSACLRCQLRHILTGTGRRAVVSRTNTRRQTARTLSASSHRCHGAGTDGANSHLDNHEKGRLSEYPLGRIYGKPGRRHRETSARLSQDSMQKPFEVVVLQDVPETTEGTRKSNHNVEISQQMKKVDAAQIARDVLDKGVTSSEAEVFRSIDALRPQATIIGDEEYSALANSLIGSYSTRQLSRYLSRALQRPTSATRGKLGVAKSKRRKNTIPVLAWRADSSSLDSDVVDEDVRPRKQDKVHNAKSTLVEQILRRPWNLSIDGEVHQMGYLEMKLKPWQLSFLFDLYEDSRPVHQKWINSPLLRRSSELRPDRVDNVLRVIARKYDAEEIAEQVQQKFQDFESLEMDLGALKPLSSRQQPSKQADLPDASLLEPIQRRLFCIFERRDSNTLLIHAPFQATLWHARRAYLALLDLPSPNSVDSVTLHHTEAEVALSDNNDNVQLMPEPFTTGPKASDNTSRYRRIAQPNRITFGENLGNTQRLDGEDSAMPSMRTKELAERLLAIPPIPTISLSTSSIEKPFWELGDTVQDGPWEVQLCRILHDSIKSGSENVIAIPRFLRSKGTAAELGDYSSCSRIQPQVPGIASLLEGCLPTTGGVKSPLMVAHFLPNPFTAHGLSPLTKLPRIRLTYGLLTGNVRSGAPTAYLHGVRAVFEEQELRVFLPHEATDLRFVRQATLRGLKRIASGDKEVQKFTAKLQNSLDRKYSFLDGEPMVKFRLPSSPFADLTDPWARDLQENNFEAEYLFERFEQVQSLDLTLGANETDPLLQQMLGESVSGVYLRYREIEAGNAGGRRTELRLVHSSVSGLRAEHGASNTSEVRASDTGRQADCAVKHSQLVDTSLRLASAITMINAGRSLQL